MDFVELEHVVVAADEDRLVRGVVDEVVGGPIADAGEGEAIRRSELGRCRVRH